MTTVIVSSVALSIEPEKNKSILVDEWSIGWLTKDRTAKQPKTKIFDSSRNH